MSAFLQKTDEPRPLREKEKMEADEARQNSAFWSVNSTMKPAELPVCTVTLAYPAVIILFPMGTSQSIISWSSLEAILATELKGQYYCPYIILRRAWVSLNFCLAWPHIEKFSFLCALHPGLVSLVQVYVTHQILGGISGGGCSPSIIALGSLLREGPIPPSHKVRDTAFHSHCLPWGFAPCWLVWDLTDIMLQESEALGPFICRPGAGGCPLLPTVFWLPLFSSCNLCLSYMSHKASVLFPSHNLQVCPCI